MYRTDESSTSFKQNIPFRIYVAEQPVIGIAPIIVPILILLIVYVRLCIHPDGSSTPPDNYVYLLP